MAMTLVETVTVGSGGAAQILFSNIPQTGKDLLVLVSPRDTTASWTSTLRLELNSNTGNNGRRLFGYIGATGSGTQRYVIVNAASSTSSTFSNVAIYISNYTSSANKVASVDSVSEGNSSTQFDVWQELATYDFVVGAVTSLRLNTDANLAQHSTASLYIIS